MTKAISRGKRGKIYRKTKGRCAYCGTKLLTGLEDRWHIDHVQPRTQGGGNQIENLLPACRPCNSRKNNRDYEAFRELILKSTANDLRRLTSRLLSAFMILLDHEPVDEGLVSTLLELADMLERCEVVFYYDIQQ